MKILYTIFACLISVAVGAFFSWQFNTSLYMATRVEQIIMENAVTEEIINSARKGESDFLFCMLHLQRHMQSFTMHEYLEYKKEDLFSHYFEHQYSSAEQFVNVIDQTPPKVCKKSG